MKADDIRKGKGFGPVTSDNEPIVNALCEIAAQLFELNEKLERLITVGADIGPYIDTYCCKKCAE